ncbi:MAG TPA: tRNA epoxyqueuosine(34) reductase QueG [Candidatus Acidoferrum sp.]|jgi:epoxyqueuosine reductase|nr:tRNA epoxyqueuosine(34) reductase QueG [Candidatus Acidoferrum sp.]
MNSAGDTAWIAERAYTLGFSLCGVAPPERFPEHAAFNEWLERGYGGAMGYLADPRRRDPEKVLAGARSVIVCALNYNTAHPYSSEAAAAESSDGPRGWISRYAWGRDYHEVLWERLNALASALNERFPESHFSRAYADTGPVAERLFAKYAGLGWLGKNTLLLNETTGSWFFLGVIFTTLELTPSLMRHEMPPADLCGNCRQCLDACPTGALVEPYVLDARRCISYLTIELRGSVPEEFREAMGSNVYGCDICQEVCPYNREALVTTVSEFEPREFQPGESLLQPRLEWLAEISEEEFREKFRGSAMKRTKWRGLVRNSCIALGNAKLDRGSVEHSRIVELLGKLAASSEIVIAESARWALSRII